MAQIVELNPGNNPNKPYVGLVEVIEGLLARARSGDLRAMAYATVAESGAQGTGWDGCAGTRHSLGTAVMMLHHRYSAELLKGGS